MLLAEPHAKYSKDFEELLEAYFPTASRADRMKISIAFCKGIEVAAGKSVRSAPAVAVDSTKQARRKSKPRSSTKDTEEIKIDEG